MKFSDIFQSRIVGFSYTPWKSNMHGTNKYTHLESKTDLNQIPPGNYVWLMLILRGVINNPL